MDFVEFLARRFDLEDYEAVFQNGANASGDGYIGIMRFFAIKSKDKAMHFVAKEAQEFKELRKLGLLKEMYILESRVYSEVFPAFKRFEKENGVDVFNSVAEMYWHNLEDFKETLIFEDLKVKGFTLYNRMKPSTWDHAVLVVKELAKLHGVSLAFKMQKPERFHQLTKDFGFNVRNFVVKTNMTVSYRQNFLDAVEVLKKHGKVDLVKKFEYMVDNYVEIYKDWLKTDGQYDTFCHSDLWMSNLMFKYEGGKPIEMKLVDFQGPAIRPPLSDVAMFLYLTCDNEVLARFDELLNEYYEIFANTTAILGTDLSRMMPKENLRKSWKDDAVFAILSAPIYIKQQLIDEKETEGFASFGVDFSKFLIGPIANPDLEQRLLDVMIHYGENFL